MIYKRYSIPKLKTHLDNISFTVGVRSLIQNYRTYISLYDVDGNRIIRRITDIFSKPCNSNDLNSKECVFTFRTKNMSNKNMYKIGKSSIISLTSSYLNEHNIFILYG